MSSTPKKRLKPKPKPEPHFQSSPNSIASLLEPSQSLFPSKHDFLRLIAVLAIASSVALTCNFLSSTLTDRHRKPYCDSSPDSLDFLPDSCEPCPSNGQCYEGKLDCLEGYKKHGKLCIEDGSIYDTSKKLAERVEIRLCEALAEFLCYGTGTIWVQENDIWNDLDKQDLVEHVGSDNVIYMYMKERTMETVNRMLDTRTNSHGVKELKCPDMLAEHYKPFSCRIRQWIAEHALLVYSVCALLVGSTFIIWKLQRRWRLATRVDELYQQVCEILEEKALMSKSVNGECEPWVVASRLRDHLLLPKERKDPILWKKVEELVQEDSHVDRYPMLVKGESKVVWEWQVEGSLSSLRRMKKGESSTLKLSKSTERSSDQHLHSLKDDAKALNFDTVMLEQ
ncbi:uncharacterized protein LOC103961103 [Pyrus x bretschneideri]|uniref:uncharacterized protein LOC103961103 n=1 Tax=Pyrus x bretschneideri TaxID=225117 RepID=UPI00202FE0C5|nr:uncharacterized protein LOC103961103 [Pyrus x bretschneideri]